MSIKTQLIESLLRVRPNSTLDQLCAIVGGTKFETHQALNTLITIGRVKLCHTYMLVDPDDALILGGDNNGPE